MSTPPDGDWYCCKADYGQHEPTCKNFKPMNTDPTDELTRLRAENALHVEAASLLSVEVERLTRERDAAFARESAKADSDHEVEELRAQLTTITAERDAARKAVDAAHEIGVSNSDRAMRQVVELSATITSLTSAAVVKDEALRELLRTEPIDGKFSEWIGTVCRMAEAALSPTSSPLLADVQAAAEALEHAEKYFRKQKCWCTIANEAGHIDRCETCWALYEIDEALARLARWITPEQKLANPPATP